MAGIVYETNMFKTSTIVLGKESSADSTRNRQKRPAFVEKAQGPMTLASCQAYVERTSKHKKSIPPDLSFENVIQDKAMPPCSRLDFMVLTLVANLVQVQLGHSTLTCLVGIFSLRFS